MHTCMRAHSRSGGACDRTLPPFLYFFFFFLQNKLCHLLYGHVYSVREFVHCCFIPLWSLRTIIINMLYSQFHYRHDDLLIHRINHRCLCYYNIYVIFCWAFRCVIECPYQQVTTSQATQRWSMRLFYSNSNRKFIQISGQMCDV